MTLRYAYFQGCSAKGNCRELDISTAAVAEHLGIELDPLEGAGCTGARAFRAISEQLHLAANGRILALAEATGHDLAVVCDTCLLNLIETNKRLKDDADARAAVNRTLADDGLEFRGTGEVLHLLWILMEDIGEDMLRGTIVRPLTGLRVAPFYGCHIRRPASAHGVSVARASSLERLCRLLGAEPVDWDGADKCCGFHGLGSDEPTALRIGGARLGEATDEAAHCVVTPCPLCHTVLDAFQPDAARVLARPFDIPVLHVSQLVGLAMGLTPRELALSRHVVDVRAILEAVSA